MHQSGLLEVELFDVCRINFMGPFPPLHNNLYILVAANYVSKWVEAITAPSNDSKVVVIILKKNLFTRFDTPRALLRDSGKHFYNKPVETLLKRFFHKPHLISPKQVAK